MLRITTVLLLLLAMLICMSSLCDISSHNTPYTNPADTMTVIHLDTLANISISVLVREYDQNTQSQQLSYDASVHFYNADTTINTDSTGYAHLVFGVDSMPFSYGYEVTKEGYTKRTYNKKETNNRIIDKITIYKEN